MPKVLLNAESVMRTCDGLLKRVLEKHLGTVVDDLFNRGDDGKDRVITLKLTFSPEFVAGVQKVLIEGSSPQPKLPPYVLPSTEARLDKNAGGLFFNDESAGRFDQTTLADHLAPGEVRPGE